jgi:predicted ATPase/nucleoside phosphorylase
MNASEFKGKVDVGIITVREDEFEAVLRRFSDVIGTASGRREYNLRRVETLDSDTYVVAVLRCAEQGNTEAQDAARDLMEDLDPQWLLVVGIAGGVPASEFTLGDVVVSTRIVDVSLESVQTEGRREYSINGGPLDRTVTTIVANLRAMESRLVGWNDPEAVGVERPAVDLALNTLSTNLYGDEEWRAKVQSSLEENFAAGPRAPLFTTGPIAASDRLIKDDSVLKTLLQGARHVLAVEMESAGIFRSAHGRKTPFLAIRGISDIVGYKRSTGWTRYACRTAAAFAYGLLRARPFPPRENPKKGISLPAPSLSDLTSRVERMIGRDELVESLAREVLKEAPEPVILLGTAGVGKSTIARAVLDHSDVRERYGERRWFVRLDAATTAEAALGQIAVKLRIGGGWEPGVAPVARMRAELARGPALLVLDNLETPWERDLRETEALLSNLAEQKELALVVSVRGAKRPAGIAWGTSLFVPPLEKDAARELFLMIAPEHRGEGMVDELVASLDGVPLAITLLAYAAQGTNLEYLFAEWKQRQTDLLEREGAAPDRLSSWRASLELSIQSPRVTPDARRIASLLAALPDGIAREDLDALFPEVGAHAARVLSQAGLLYFAGGRLLQLAPVRAYLAREYPGDVKDLDRVMEWYGELARTLGPTVGRDGGKEAADRLAPEVANLDAMIRRGLSSGEVTRWIETAIALSNFAVHSGYVSLSPLEAALEAARQAKEHECEAKCLEELGRIAQARSDVEKAKSLLEEALVLSRRVNYVQGEAECLWNLGVIALVRAQHDRAKEHFEAAIPLFRRTRDVLGEANCVRGLGDIKFQRAEHKKAKDHYTAAVTLYHRANDALGEANCIHALGDISFWRDDVDEASARHEEALKIFRRIGTPLGEANCILHLGDIELRRENKEQAIARFEEARRLYGRVGNLLGEANCIKGLADVELFLDSDFDRAAENYEEALKGYRKGGDKFGEANCIRRLGDIAHKRSDLDQAAAHYRRALALYIDFPHPLSIGDIHLRLAELTADPQERRRHVRAARAAWSSIEDRPDLVAKLDNEFGRELFRDRIAEIRVNGLRTIERLTLPLRGLTVLIGENGTGKSSLIEACEILRRASGPQIFTELHGVHGGLFNLLRDGAQELRLAARVEGDEPILDYEITFAFEGTSTVIAGERLRIEPHEGAPEPINLIDRGREGARIFDSENQKMIPIGPTQSVLGSAGLFSPHPAITRMKDALADIEVHVAFEVLPLWVSRAHDRRSTARTSIPIEQTNRLSCLGDNLANAYHALRINFSEEHWQTTMEYVRLGLGDDVESIDTRVDEGGGAIALWLKRRNRDRRLPASALSDGALAYLSFVALLRLNPTGRTLLAFDEPELHLHPALLVRVVDFFETLAEAHPVLVATQSDRLLDVLRDPARSVRVCEIDGEQHATRLRELDPDALKEWLEEYRGLGDLRGAGYLSTVLKSEESA